MKNTIGPKIYQALKHELPECKSDEAISRKVGLCRGHMTKIKNGETPGPKAAEWLANHDSKYQPLLEECLNTKRSNLSKGHKKAGKTKAENAQKGIDLSELPRPLQAFVGYVP